MTLSGLTLSTVMHEAGMRVLVIDDEESLCKVLQLSLERAGYTVKTTTSGLAAPAIARKFNPHAILCDLNLDYQTASIRTTAHNCTRMDNECQLNRHHFVARSQPTARSLTTLASPTAKPCSAKVDAHSSRSIAPRQRAAEPVRTGSESSRSECTAAAAPTAGTRRAKERAEVVERTLDALLRLRLPAPSAPITPSSPELGVGRQHHDEADKESHTCDPHNSTH